MTMVVAWRDPFCLVADSREVDRERCEPLSKPVKKLKLISNELAVGLAGYGLDFTGIVAELTKESPTDWATLELLTHKIVSGIRLRPDPRFHDSVVVAGTIGSKRHMFACGARAGMVTSGAERDFAYAGSGERRREMPS